MSADRRRRVAAGHVAVVTGASSGIGRAIAHELARRGASVVLAARSESSLHAVAEECSALGGTTLVVPVDVTGSGALEGLVARALGRFGRIDSWIGAASVFAFGTIESTPGTTFARVLEVNLNAQIRGVRAVLPALRESRGSIVLIGSVFSRVGMPYVGAYVTSKHGLLGFATVARQELRRDGVALSTVLPATVDTPIYQHAANVTGRRGLPIPPLLSADRVARVAVRRIDHPRPVSTVGILQRGSIPLQRLAPSVFDALAARLAPRLLLGDAEPPDNRGTLFAPRPHTNRVSGGWRAAGYGVRRLRPRKR